VFQSENCQLQAFLREVGDLMTCYNPGGSRLGFAQNAAEVVGPFVIEPAELIQVTICLVVNDRFCCFLLEAAYVDQEGLNVLGCLFLGCLDLCRGQGRCGGGGAILADLILVWSIRRVVYGKLRRPFCFGSEGASSKRGQANARRHRKGCKAYE